MNEPQRVIDRVFSNYDVIDTGCWISRYKPSSSGYSMVSWSDNGVPGRRLVHRVVWEHLNGPITGGLVVDHICHVRRCINPAHLRLLTHAENVRDQPNALKSHCPRGHPYSGKDLYIVPKTGHRQCRACARFRRSTHFIREA